MVSALFQHQQTAAAHSARQHTAAPPRCLQQHNCTISGSSPCLSASSGRHNWQAAPGLHICQPVLRQAVIAAAVDTLTYGSEWTTPRESYVVLGLAHCFERGEDGGKLQDVYVIEPVSANSLECMVAGAQTCFKTLVGVTLEDAMSRDKSKLPADFAEAAFCEDYDFRCDATARTWLRPHAQDNLLDIVPLGASKANFNYSVDQKRVLNMENVVNDDDNIKQDMSIDVYGRKEEEEAPDASSNGSNGAAEEPVAAAKADADDDGLDDLFGE